jgi:hypothetical protein
VTGALLGLAPVGPPPTGLRRQVPGLEPSGPSARGPPAPDGRLASLGGRGGPRFYILT